MMYQGIKYQLGDSKNNSVLKETITAFHKHYTMLSTSKKCGLLRSKENVRKRRSGCETGIQGT